MITINDMAEMAGVSPTTVANVLHGRTKKVSQATLTKVLKVINDCNYVSNMGARILANQSSHIIGVIITSDRREEINAIQDPFYSEIIGALEKEIREHGYYMMIYTSADVEESLTMASAWSIEGLIVISSPPSECAKFKISTTIPLVFIDGYFEHSDEGYVNVGLNDYNGAYDMTNYLIQQGHRGIAFLADGNDPIAVDKQRLEGYKQALKENHIRYQKTNYIPLDYQKSIRGNQLRHFCDTRLEDFTALFFSSDFYAVDALNTFLDNGLNIPEDISIVGFDDNIYSQQCRPMLTTVQQNVSLKAIKAVDLLLTLIRQEPLEHTNIQLNTKLVIRNSVKNINSLKSIK